MTSGGSAPLGLSFSTCAAEELTRPISEYLPESRPGVKGPSSLTVSLAWTGEPRDPGPPGLTPAPPLAGCAAWTQSLASLCLAVPGCGVERAACHRGLNPESWDDRPLPSGSCVSSRRVPGLSGPQPLTYNIRVTVTRPSVSSCPESALHGLAGSSGSPHARRLPSVLLKTMFGFIQRCRVSFRIRNCQPRVHPK